MLGSGHRADQIDPDLCRIELDPFDLLALKSLANQKKFYALASLTLKMPAARLIWG